LTLASNHNLVDGSTVVLQNVEEYAWSSSTNLGFALQQGGQLQDYTASAPTRVHAVIGSGIESFALTSSGAIYDLVAGGQLQVSTNSGKTWLVVNTQTESFAVTSAGTLYDLQVGGQLSVLPVGGAWQVIDSNTMSFTLTSSGSVYNLLVGGTLEVAAGAGNTWTTLDSQTESFAVTTSGTLYDLDNGGQLRILPAGGKWKTLDANTQSFAVTPGNTIYNLRTGGALETSTNSGSTWTTIGSAAQSFSLAANGAIYALNTGGQLRLLSHAGGTWQTLDTATQSFGLTTAGVLYDLDTNGLLQYLTEPGSAWNFLDNATQSFAINANGLLFDLDLGGQLWDIPLGDYWQWLDNYTQAFSITSNGTIYNLLTDGTLESTSDPSGSWNYWDYTALSFAISANGTLFDFEAGSGLWYVDPSGNWQFLDNATQTFAVNGNGTLFDLDSNGQLWSLALGGYWQFLNDNTQSFALSGNGTLFNLDNGFLERSTNSGATWIDLDSDTQAFNVTANGALDNLPVGGLPQISTNAGNSWSDWFATALPDSGVANLAESDFIRDGQLTRADFLGLFNEVEADGAVTGAELFSMQALVDTSAVPMADYVRNLAGKIVNGNPANGYFQGQWLGNLYPGSSASTLDALVQKWFYGADHPQTDIDPTTGAPFSYALAGGTLYGSSGAPNVNDIAQGITGDCYFLSALGQVAMQAPTEIENMIVDNGDGTYTVRFFNNGVADYVTVDGYLPVDSTGAFIYANQMQYGWTNGELPTYVADNGNVLWAALAEKAYAQLAEEGWSLPGGWAANSYDAIGNGGQPALVLWQISGGTTGVGIFTADAGAEAAVTDAIANAAAQNLLITISTYPPGYAGFATGLPGAPANFWPGHIYMLGGYDPNYVDPTTGDTGLFTFIDPYADDPTRVVQVTWSQLMPYVAAFQVMNSPRGVSAISDVSALPS
jgi:hypothetical protein